MKPSIERKLTGLSERLEELEALLSDAQTLSDAARFREMSREYARINPIVGCFRRYQAALAELAAAREMLQDADPAVRALAEEELHSTMERTAALENEITGLLLPVDEHDSANIFLEIRAGTGGDEAALFAGDLLRMYLLYAEQRRWQTEIISSSEGEHGGYKEVIARIIGRNAYARLKFESGVHRVQRVPATESQGRIHTSACTVAVLAEPEEIEDIEINPAELRIDTYRSSGAGGQHVNKTDSAIRITHLPTGIVVECQNERSQHKNRAQAMALLQARLQADAEAEQTAAQAHTRKTLVGSGDRSERIRTYNFPQGRITDHRVNVTLYKLDDVLAGNLDPVIDPLISEYQAEQLARLGD